jgi:hypothetical protein
VESTEEEFNVEAFEVDLESLVIPPPPGEASVSLDKISIVPPVTFVSDDNENKSHRGNHRRSSSVDNFLCKFPKNEQNLKNDSNSDEKEHINLKNGSECKSSDTHRRKTDASVNVSSNSVHNDSEKATSNLSESNHQENDSPGSVSEKLNTLLQMIPSLVPKSDSDSDYNWRRTSSLRLSKPVPMYDKDKANLPNGVVKSEVTKGKPDKANSVLSPVQVVKSSHEEKQKKGEVTVSSKYSRHLRRTNSFDIPAKDEASEKESEKAVTEGFSSLKAKLQSYRDYLLSKSNNSKKERKVEEKKEEGPLKRSNSFTLSYLRRRNSSSDSDDQKSGTDVAPSRSRRREKKLKEKSDDKDDKKTPALWNQLAAPRSFRPHSSTTTQVSIS